MCDDRKWMIRLMLWAGLLLSGLVGLSACAGDPPSALGLICIAGQDSKNGGCWGDGVICSNDFCREANKACPNSCSSNFDCRAAGQCGKNVSCKDGKCIDPKNDCPDSCQSDADCAVQDCGSKKTCHPKDKICVTAPNQQCKEPCTNNIDCAGCQDNKTSCKDTRCVAPAVPNHIYACIQNKTCSPGWSCGQDGPTTNLCTKPNCQKDADCDEGKGSYACFAPPNKTKACHLLCKDGSCPVVGLKCCSNAAPGLTAPFCVINTNNCPPG